MEARHLLELDFKNAFNTIRDKVLHVVRNLIPDYLNYISSNYWEPNMLFCGDDTIPSNIGVQQGDPISPTLFCLVVNQLPKTLEPPLNLWYLDDATLGGKAKVVLEDMANVTEGADELRVELNAAKCELLVTGGSEVARRRAVSTFRKTAPQLRVMKSEDLELLESPMLSKSVSLIIEDMIGQARVLTGRIGLLPAYQALFILKNCLSLPKNAHTLLYPHVR